jgi:hypothetical protein
MMDVQWLLIEVLGPSSETSSPMVCCRSESPVTTSLQPRDASRLFSVSHSAEHANIPREVYDDKDLAVVVPVQVEALTCQPWKNSALGPRVGTLWSDAITGATTVTSSFP